MHKEAIETTIPERIKAARIAANLTQKQVGEALGYANNGQIFVARWESGDRPIPMIKIKDIANLLNLDPLDLIP